MKFNIPLELFNKLQIPFAVFREGKVVHISQLIENLLGISLSGEYAEVAEVFGDSAAAIEEHLQEVLKNSYAESVVVCSVHSEKIPVVFRTIAVEENGELYLLSFLEPLSNIKRKIKSFAFMGCSIPGIIHNVSNPMTVVLNKIQIMKMKGIEPDQMTSLITEIRKIQDIFDNVSLKSIKEMKNEEGTIDINIIIKVNMEFLNANSYVKHKIRKEVVLNNLPRMVRGRFLDLSQIFLAFFYIIFKSVEDKGDRFIRVETGYKDGKVHINFSSNGVSLEELVESAIEKVLLDSNTYTGCFVEKINLGWTFEGLKHLLDLYQVDLDYGTKPDGNYLSLGFIAEEMTL